MIRVVVFGASGMIGQGVMSECLADPEVAHVLSVVRAPTGQTAAKLTELVHADFTNFATAAGQLTGYDACLFCLGVSSAGMKEAEYKRITYDYTIAAAEVLAAANPTLTFIYVSGASTDSTEKGRTMWARVKGATENALLRLPFKAAYMFRPAYIQPCNGIKSRTKWTRVMYTAFGWGYPLWKLLFKNYVTSTEELAHAMLNVAKHGAPKQLIEPRDVAALAATTS